MKLIFIPYKEKHCGFQNCGHFAGINESRHYLTVLPVGPQEKADHVSQSWMLQKKISGPNSLLSRDIENDKLYSYPDRDLFQKYS